jgi:hypothetical protein
MKYTIMGFNQRKVLEITESHNIKLDCNDLLILAWFANFRGSGKMKLKLVDETPYYWVAYKTILDDLPILDIAPQAIGRRFKKYVDVGLFDRISEIESANGSKVYYALKDSYFELISSTKSAPTVSLERTATVSLERTAIIEEDLITIIHPQLTTAEIEPSGCVLFEKFWNAYPKKVDMPGAITAFENLGVNEQLLGIMLTVIARERKSEQWQKEKGRFIPHPVKWLTQRRWESQTDVIGENQYSGYGRE